MAILQRLEVSRVRNLNEVRIEPGKQVNIIHGDNGSGKTSLLESIYMLGVGRSFRSNKLDPVIQVGASDCTVFGDLGGSMTIGLTKSRNQTHQLRFRGQREKSWADVARNLPVQILNSDTFALLEGSPKVRRKFLDWGVFHVEPEFVINWRDAGKCLSNRNHLLKQHRLDREQLHAWNAEFARLGGLLDAARTRYFSSFLPVFRETLIKLIDLEDVSMAYARGWEQGQDLEDILENNIERDRRYGATQQGPHRADLIVKVGKANAVDVLSRGQQKMLVSALKIAQGHLLSSANGKASIYLVDDLPSELDRVNKLAVCRLLAGLDSQIFMTSVGAEDLANCWASGVITAKFHVEHGKIAPAELS